MATASPYSTIPTRAEGLELLGTMEGSGYKQAPSLVRRIDGQTIQLTPLLSAVLEAIDGRRNFAAIADVVSDRIGKRAAAADVEYLIEEKLRPLGLLQTHEGLEPINAKANPLLALRWKYVVTNPRITRKITAPFAQLFRPWIAAPLLIAFIAVSVWVLMEKGLASATHQALYEPGLLLVIFGLTMLSAGFHEFGHAAACRYGGATPGAMGVGLYLVWPAFYTEVSDSYRLDRRGRLRVDVGGLYFNAIFAVAMLGLWAMTRWDAILLLVPAQLLQMLRQMLPFVRFDGYHILADLTGVPDLFSHLKPTVLAMLPGRWRRPQPQTLKRWARTVVTIWVLLVIPVLLFSLFMMIKVMPRIVATAFDSLAQQWAVLQQNWADEAYQSVVVGILSMFTIALPVAAITYLLTRVTRRTVRGVWRATAGKPKARAAAVLAGAALLALLAWAWWPDGQYKPIEADERGALIGGIDPYPQGVPRLVTIAGSAQPLFAPMSRPVEIPAGQAPGALVAGAEAKPALVLTPVGDPDAPETIIVLPEPTGEEPDSAGDWPFPFNPPRLPREQDNQALAVNTVDGSTVYDVAFALVWVTDGDVDERNDAYALASCTDCLTVAVAFQVVFVIGQADMIIPQNIAVAVNYSCNGCTSYALAVQLIATLNDTPSDEAMARITALWEQVEAFGEMIEDVPLEQIAAYIAYFERELLRILMEEDGASATSNVDEMSGEMPTQEPTDDPTTEPASTESTESTEGSVTTTESGEPVPVDDTATEAVEETSVEPTGDAVEPAPTTEATTTEGTTEQEPTESAPAESTESTVESTTESTGG